MRPKGLDLNLLVALDILLEERSVSRAAKRLYLSQPAVSAALGRLREYFNDELLILYGKRLIPTSYAESLVPQVKHVLTELDELLSLSMKFDPSNSERLFRLMASDYISTVLLSRLHSVVSEIAPSIKLDVRFPEEQVLINFERGEIDFVLIPEVYMSHSHPAELLFEEKHVLVCCKNNQCIGNRVSENDFINAEHIAVSIGPNREPTFIELSFEQMGFHRRVDVQVPHFSCLPWFIMNTRRVAVIQERLALQFSRNFPVRILPLPFKFPAMKMMVQYHNVHAKDKGLQWFLKLLKDTACEKY